MVRKLKKKLKKTIKKKMIKKAIKKKTIKKKLKSAKKPLDKAVKTSPIKRAAVVKKENKQMAGFQETLIEKSKFSVPSVQKAAHIMPQELPAGYQDNMIVLQVRDPRWLHSYWEVTSDRWESLKGKLGDAFYTAKRVLRVYDISQIIFDGKNAHRFFDIEIGPDASNWYINVGAPGRSWCVDLGLKLASGEFIMLLRSNTVHTPLDGPSWITDEEWMIPEDMFARLYGRGLGLGKSSPVGKAWQERKKGLFSGALASPSSPVKAAAEKKFWLAADCELVVYGATQSDAKVTVAGKEIKLRPDGTFTLRFALPDGKQAIPIKAKSCDKVEKRTITPVISRKTK